MRIIFLDFDGVLCTEKYKARLLEKGMSYRDECGMMLFAPSSVANLKRILDAVPDVRIIVEDTWTTSCQPDELRCMWLERRLPGTPLDVIQTIFGNDILDIGLSSPADTKIVEDTGKNRAIRTWLNQYAGPDCRYVILDDMADFRGKLYEHTVYVNPWVGLTESDANETVKLLI